MHGSGDRRRFRHRLAPWSKAADVTPGSTTDLEAMSAAGDVRAPRTTPGLVCAINNYPANGLTNCLREEGRQFYYWSYWQGDPDDEHVDVRQRGSGVARSQCRPGVRRRLALSGPRTRQSHAPRRRGFPRPQRSPRRARRRTTTTTSGGGGGGSSGGGGGSTSSRLLPPPQPTTAASSGAAPAGGNRTFPCRRNDDDTIEVGREHRSTVDRR